MAARTGLTERQVAQQLARLEDAGKIIAEDGWVSLPAPATAAEPRRRRDGGHTELRAKRQEREVAVDPMVCALREELLGNRLLDRVEVADWLRRREVREGRGAGWVEYVEDSHVRALRVGDDLRPLAQYSEVLAEHYGWSTSSAVDCILTGRAPRMLGRVVSTPQYLTITIPLDEDAEMAAVLARYEMGRRQALSERDEPVVRLDDDAPQENLPRRRRPQIDDAQRQSELAVHVAEHGNGVEGWQLWKNRHPDFPYASRTSYWRAARRAQAATAST